MTESADRIADDLLALLGSDRQIPPLTSRLPDFGLAEAYRVAERIRILRQNRGERPVGRKIAFTNRTIWPNYNLTAPSWGYMYDTTVADLPPTGGTLDVAAFAEPRIEPEIVLHLAAAPHPGMDDARLIGCIDWVAHGFEIVQSVFPGWKFAIADVTAAFGLHGALRLGTRHDISADRAAWLAPLADFGVELLRNGLLVEAGHARNVLGGPLSALRFLIDELARYPECRPLASGEIVTTGTLTDAHPAISGEQWTTVISGLPVEGLDLRFT